MLINFNKLVFFPKKVTGIIHIGAHNLEELSDYLKGNVDRIVWIEANPEKYAFIESKLMKFKHMKLGKFAAGSKDSYLPLNLANNGQSSSLLDLGTHKYSYPNINYTSQIEVEVKTLDKWINDNVYNKDLFNFINIDIQGYELEALRGMTNHLRIADYIYIEVNFEQVYKGCSELKDIDKFLIQYGFSRVGIRKTNKGWGDAIYAKNYIFMQKFYYYFLLQLIRFILLPKFIFKYFVKLVRFIIIKK